MSSSELCAVEKTGGEKMWSYLRRNPGDFDVSFCVGPQKEVVKGVKLILKSASAVLEQEFSDKWECAVSNNAKGIPLPDFDPKAFQLFIKLLILDTWSADALKNLNLPLDDILNLLQVCRRFEIAGAVKHLEEESDNLIREFHLYVRTKEFLLMSQANLKIVISSDAIPMAENDLFEAVCKWAEFQCGEKSIAATGDNIRLVLGGCLFHIRFPLMSSSDFGRIRLKNVLSVEERLAIYDFIALTDQQKKSFASSDFLFKTQVRTSVGLKLPPRFFHHSCLILSLSANQKIDTATPFPCEGKTNFINKTKSSLSSNEDSPTDCPYFYRTCFEPNQKIALHGLGFLGPNDADAKYDVSVKIRSYNPDKSPQNKIVLSKHQKQITAMKSKPFYWIFEDPLVLQLNIQTEHGSLGYELHYTLIGPPTPAYDRPDGMNQQVGGVIFRSQFSSGHQALSEIIFQKV